MRNTIRKKIRQIYYNIFSHIYDAFVKLHSGDTSQALRKWLVETADLRPGMKILDLCTGTGSVAIKAKEKIKDRGMVAGVDFSEGMLKKAIKKSDEIFWIQADVTELPFKKDSFDIVFLAYGFYELKDKDKFMVLREICRVLSRNGRFLMMEHEEPENQFIRFLYRIRLLTMGSLSSVDFIKKETQIISGFFERVKNIKSLSGNSKIIIAEIPKDQAKAYSMDLHPG